MHNTDILSKSAIDQFRAAMAQKGLVPPDVIEADGKIHRFSSNGKPDDDAGWYVFSDSDIATGAFGDFRTGQRIKSWVADMGRVLSPVEKSSLRTKQEEIRAQRESDGAERRVVAQKKATNMFRYAEAAPNGHPYLLRKEVKPYGLKVWKDMLLVPMIDVSGEIQSLQMISGNGDKKFLSGGKMQGCYFTLGTLKDADMILIAEGYATAATLHEISGHPVVVAYNAGNLLAVSKSIRAQYPDTPIFLCADDDYKTKGNPGLTKAADAALAIEGGLIVPTFGDNRPDGATDFNDMAVHLGKDAVSRFFINHFLSENNNRFSSSTVDSDNEPDVFLSGTADFNQTIAPIEIPDEIEQPKPKIRATHYPLPPPVLPTYDPVIEPKAHFSAEEFALIDRIWKEVPRRTSLHSETGYQLEVDDKSKVIVTKDRIEFAGKAKHRPDAAYTAACEHARQFWNAQIEVKGDSQHCITAWAHASVHGIQVTNFIPNERERVEAEKIISSLRKDKEPAFRRPSTVRPSQGARPSL